MSPSHISLYSDENCNNVISFADILRDTPEMKVTLHCYFRYRKKCFPVNVQAFRILDDKLDTVDRRQRRTAQKKQRRLCSEFSVNAYPHGKTVHNLRSSEPEAVTEPPPMAARSVLDRLA